jgi:hypothetical protein
MISLQSPAMCGLAPGILMSETKRLRIGDYPKDMERNHNLTIQKAALKTENHVPSLSSMFFLVRAGYELTTSLHRSSSDNFSLGPPHFGLALHAANRSIKSSSSILHSSGVGFRIAVDWTPGCGSESSTNSIRMPNRGVGGMSILFFAS